MCYFISIEDILLLFQEIYEYSCDLQKPQQQKHQKKVLDY